MWKKLATQSSSHIPVPHTFAHQLRTPQPFLPFKMHDRLSSSSFSTDILLEHFRALIIPNIDSHTPIRSVRNSVAGVRSLKLNKRNEGIPSLAEKGQTLPFVCREPLKETGVGGESWVLIKIRCYFLYRCTLILWCEWMAKQCVPFLPHLRKVSCKDKLDEGWGMVTWLKVSLYDDNDDVALRSLA